MRKHSYNIKREMRIRNDNSSSNWETLEYIQILYLIFKICDLKMYIFAFTSSFGLEFEYIGCTKKGIPDKMATESEISVKQLNFTIIIKNENFSLYFKFGIKIYG